MKYPDIIVQRLFTSKRNFFLALFIFATIFGATQTVQADKSGSQSQQLNEQIIGYSKQIDSLTAQNKTLTEQVNQLTAEKQALQERLVFLDAASGSFPYSKLYPEMTASPPSTFREDAPKTVYLTFDDGPSKETTGILDTLKEKNVKATFFLVGVSITGHEDLLKRMVAEGHTIGIHSYTHQYREIYASVEAFLEDFHKTYVQIYEACGVYPTIFRFPGGSINTYNGSIYKQIIAEMLRRGYLYYDWNISPEEMAKKVTSAQLVQTVLTKTARETSPLILLHDSNTRPESAEAVSCILSGLLEKGYTFAPLDNAVRPVTFGYR